MKPINKIFAPAILLTVALSCGKAPDLKKPQVEALMPDGSNIDGIYVADLYPINVNLNFIKGIGKAAIERSGDNVKAVVRLENGGVGAIHKQDIYLADRCPNVSDDANKDAFIDMVEAKTILGDVLIPLDDNIDSQAEGSYVFPLGNFAAPGDYYYQRTTSFEKLFADLKTPDEDPSDEFMKLKDDEGLSFIGKIIVVRGAMGAPTGLPQTIASTSGDPIASIPIACGILFKAETMPADFEGRTQTGEMGLFSQAVPTPQVEPVPVPEPGPTPVPGEPEPTPTPTPVPQPTPTPDPDTDPEPEEEEDDRDIGDVFGDIWDDITGGGGDNRRG